MGLVLDWVEQAPERHYVDWKVFRLLVWTHPRRQGKWMWEVGTPTGSDGILDLLAHNGNSIAELLPSKEAAKEAAERAAREVGIAIPEADA